MTIDSWHFDILLVDSDQGRTRAVELGLPQYLCAALASNEPKVVHQALAVMDALSDRGSKSAAALVEIDGLIPALSRLIGKSTGFGASNLADAAARSLQKLVESVPEGFELTALSERTQVMSAPSVLERAAVLALVPTLTRLNAPRVADARTDSLTSSRARTRGRSTNLCVRPQQEVH